MRNPLEGRLTYANAMSTLAVFVALGGSSYAALHVDGGDVENGSLTGTDVNNNSLTGKDVKRLKSKDVSDGSLLAKDFKSGQLPQGPQGPAGTARAYAHVAPNGDIDPALSKGVPSGNIHKAAQEGVYCLKGLSFTPTNAVATRGDYGVGVGISTDIGRAGSYNTSYACPAGTQISIATYTQAGLADSEFSLLIN